MAFTQQSRKIVYDAGFISMVKATFLEHDSGETFERTYVDHLGAVMVIPIMDNGDIMLVEQYRAAIDDMSIEVVAGRKDKDDEEFSICALRELKEEIGVEADTIELLGQWVSTPGFTNELIHGYVAYGCRETGINEPDGIEEQLARSLRVSFDEAFDLINQGKIVDMKSVLLIYQAAILQGVPLRYIQP